MNELNEILNVLALVSLGYWILILFTIVVVIFTVRVTKSFLNDIKKLRVK